MRLQVRLWCQQGRLEEAKSGALRAVSMFRTLGLRPMWRIVESSSGISKREWESWLLLVDRTLTVSSPNRRYFLHLLIPHLLLEGSSDGTDGCLDFSHCVLQQTPGRVDPFAITFLIIFILSCSLSFQRRHLSH
jgi:hypothetical protein